MSRKSACVCCEEEDDLDNINFITMSESGKPIWARRRRRRQQQRDDDEDHDDDSDNDNDCTKCSGMSESQLLRVCGLVQALRASLLCHETSLQLGDIQSVQSESHSIVFLTVDSITLLAIAKRRRYHHHHHKGGSPLHVLDDTEAFLRLQLEYIFAQIMFMVTEQIQDMFRQNPSLDLRHVWGAHSDRLLDDLVDKISTTNGGNNNNNNNNPAPFFTMAVETVFPLSAATRERLSSILQEQTTDNENNNTLYAILFSGSSSNNNNNNNKPKLVTLVQPSIRQHQLRVADLHLLLHFLTRQMESHAAAAAAAAATPSSSTTTTTTTAAADLWLPLCLPHLHAGGFIYSYTHAIPVTLPLESSSSTTTTTSVTLALLSAQGTTEQFQTFRQMAAQIERSLGLTAAPAATASSRTPSVLEISGGTGSSQQQQQDHHHPSATVPTSSAKDANAPPSMTRSHLHVSSMHSSTSSMDNGDDYVDASGEGDRIIPYLPDEREEQSRRQLLQELSQALHTGGVTVRNNDVHHNHDVLLLLDTYLNLAHAWHFLFRLNVPIRSSSEGRTIGHLPQCLSALSSSSFFQDSKDDNGGSNNNNNNNDSMTTMTTTSTTTRYKIMWKAYQRLNLRLRLGSSGSEACDDAFDMIQHDLQNDHQKKKQSNSSSSSRRHHYHYHHHHHLKQNPTIGKHCPAMGLLEAPPNLEGVTYLTVGENTYFAMGGRDFELYLSTRSSIPSEEVAASAARLARRLLQDQEKLFVLKLLTWREI